jgi:L-amino acid N-acyltransferase YncA
MEWRFSQQLYSIPGCDELAVEKFQAKINQDNDKSILMFQKMGFVKVRLML